MAEFMPKEKIQELKEMLQEKNSNYPVEKVLVDFCSRHGVSIDACRKYYDGMIKKGEINRE